MTGNENDKIISIKIGNVLTLTRSSPLLKPKQVKSKLSIRTAYKQGIWNRRKWSRESSFFPEDWLSLRNVKNEVTLQDMQHNRLPATEGRREINEYFKGGTHRSDENYDISNQYANEGNETFWFSENGNQVKRWMKMNNLERKVD